MVQINNIEDVTLDNNREEEDREMIDESPNDIDDSDNEEKAIAV